MRKLSNFIFKNGLKMQLTRNCDTESFAPFPRSLTGKVQLCHLEGYCEPMSKGEVSKFFLFGKHLLWEMNIAFDVGSQRDF